MKKLLLLLMILPVIGFGQKIEEKEFVDVFISVEQMPLFGDCKDQECTQTEIMKFISRNFKYPKIAKENGVEGRVYVEFVIEKCGHVDRVKIVNGLSAEIDKEAIKVIRLLPKFQPGIQFGEPAPVKFITHVKCSLG